MLNHPLDLDYTRGCVGGWVGGWVVDRILRTRKAIKLATRDTAHDDPLNVILPRQRGPEPFDPNNPLVIFALKAKTLATSRALPVVFIDGVCYL